MKEFFTSERLYYVVEMAATICISILLAFFINKFIIFNSHIPSGSMETTIMTGDDLFVYRLSYLFSEPKRFDIIVFRPPHNDNEFYIKRVIGLPGEKLEIKNGKVYINDSAEPLEESFLTTEPYGSCGPFFIPQDCYFVMGDNRNSSYDSRAWPDPYVRRKKIVGKPLFRMSPKLGFIE